MENGTVHDELMDTDDIRLAEGIAALAGELLLRIRAAGATDPRALGRAGDQGANEFLLARLTQARPEDAVLSEESADNPARLAAPRVWIIDPLDGTREFTMPGHDDWAVHVALHTAGRGLTAAAVAIPALGEVWSSATRPIPTVGSRIRPRVLVSASRPPEFADRVAAAIGADLVPMGSAGAKAMAVLRGEADAYLHAGGQWEWDSAAPVGVVQAAGLHACRIDGSPLRYNQRHPYLPDLVICRPDLAEPLLAAIAAG
jgi:3'(2'), 5'-bisphosphate nucleotidase